MSLPVVLPGSCCPVPGVSLAFQSADPSFRSRSRCVATRALGSQSRLFPAILPGRPLLSLGLLQLVLGCSMVALSFGALSLSSSAPIRNSCPFWAGSSVILSGIIGLTTWRRPMLLLVNLFILLSVVCVLLNLAGFVLCCQGAQLVSSMSSCQLSEDVCLCCEDSSKCSDLKQLKLYPGHSCSTVRILLKKVLFALCALNALTTAVCLVAAALRYLQLFAARRPCIDEPHPASEEVEEQAHVPDLDEFVPPIPPPSYFSTFYSYTPRVARRMLGNSVIPLPHIYGARIKGVEVICPLDPPPPYEAVASPSGNNEQVSDLQVSNLTEGACESIEASNSSEDSDSQNPPSLAAHPKPSQAPVTEHRRSCRRVLRRSISDPVLLDLAAKAVMSCEAATQTEARPELAAVTLRRSGRSRCPRPARPTSLVDYQTYRDTKQLVARFMEQSSCTMTPEVQELVDNIKTVLKSDEEHMEEVVLSANVIDQITSLQQPPRNVQTLPLRKRPGLLHLRSCGDLSTFTRAESQPAGRQRQRGEQDRPHSLIGVVRETVL
ncbi:protein FAM189A2 isoform X3 [Huso huso]|uniref:Protein FAM189A2 isoform X3 n=1 Tax=Huso huso TaxID=61971 RepID=A0ABR1ACN3_HUSHU